MSIRITSNNYSGYTTDITFSPASGGTQVINNAVIPYEFNTTYPYGDYSIYIQSFGNTCPLTVPTPTFTASISPTGTTQYENVILSGSSDLNNPTYIWTLTDFYDVSGNTISSYTGQTLQEGYFTSTGNTSVQLDVVGEDVYGNTFTATTTDFSVSAFDISSYQSNMYLWVDYSDSSTLSTRIDGSDTYITQIDNKATNGNINNLSQTFAAQQPLLQSGGTLFNDSSLTYGYYPSGSTDVVLISDVNFTGQTHHHFVAFHSDRISTDSQSIWSIRDASLRPLYFIGIQPNAESCQVRFLEQRTSSNQGFVYGNLDVVGQADVVENKFDLTKATDGNYIVNSGITINQVDYGLNDITTIVGTQNTSVSSPYLNNAKLGLGNRPDTPNAQINGAIAEYIVFPTILSESDRRKINRYLIYKWVA